MRVGAMLLTALLLAPGCKKNDDPAPDERATAISPSAPANPTGSEAVRPPIAGRIMVTKILDECFNTDHPINRVAVADKYFGKYWELDLTGETFRCEREYMFVNVWIKTERYTQLRFRDRRDLLKFKIDSANKRTGPTVVVGKAVDATKFEDCYVP